MAYFIPMAHPITQYRQEKKLTLQKLGEQVGLSKGSVCDVEAGRKRLSPEKAMQIEAATGIPRHELRPDLWPAPFITTDGTSIDRDTGESLPRKGRAA
jgi:transcriptional regulator with XRE-family HTH domain